MWSPNGFWDQVIYKKAGDHRVIEKIDEVLCVQTNDLLTAVIKRIHPAGQRERLWQFQGRYHEGHLIGHYWPERGTGSFGTILMRRLGDYLDGRYLKLSEGKMQELDTYLAAPELVPLQWWRPQDPTNPKNKLTK